MIKMGDFYDHPTKTIIREQWCKPLLKHIHENLGHKLVYLGLPGINSLDIHSWIDYLEKVVAFDCGDYNDPPDVEKAKKNIEILNENLRQLERKGQLKNFSLYQGFIEKVVLKGLDEKGNKFAQNDFVTVYHLDFCNSLTVPLVIVDPKGNSSKHYKTEVISKLLEYERDFALENENKKFVMFLTINSLFWETEAEKLLGQIDSDTYKDYMASISKLDKKEKELRLLKLYAFYVLRNHFCDRHFIPDFLTPVYYKGIGDNWLICFTIIGTYHKNPSGSAPYYQDIKKLLKTSFLFADKKQIKLLKNKNLTEIDSELNPLLLFTKTTTYQTHWKRRK
ncbi:MAG: hypothetical protein ABIC91_07735 [Nanoarchaeota archaeon]